MEYPEKGTPSAKTTLGETRRRACVESISWSFSWFPKEGTTCAKNPFTRTCSGSCYIRRNCGHPGIAVEHVCCEITTLFGLKRERYVNFC